MPYFLSQRYFQGMKVGTILLPRELQRPVDALPEMLGADIERQGTPYTLVGMTAGDLHQVRRDFAIRCFGTHHGRCEPGICPDQRARKTKTRNIQGLRGAGTGGPQEKGY